MNMPEHILNIAKNARAASFELSRLSTDVKNRALHAMADALVANSGVLKDENGKDLAR